MLLPNGHAVIVDRGFALLDTPEAELDPPGGMLQISGIVRASQQRGWIGPRDPAAGDLAEIARVDVERLSAQISEPVVPGVYVELVEPAGAIRRSPDLSDPPVPVASLKPTLDEGPHLNYAVQWAEFCVVTLIAYAAILRRSIRLGRSRTAAQHSAFSATADPSEAQPFG